MYRAMRTMIMRNSTSGLILRPLRWSCAQLSLIPLFRWIAPITSRLPEKYSIRLHITSRKLSSLNFINRLMRYFLDPTRPTFPRFTTLTPLRFLFIRSSRLLQKAYGLISIRLSTRIMVSPFLTHLILFRLSVCCRNQTLFLPSTLPLSTHSMSTC